MGTMRRWEIQAIEDFALALVFLFFTNLRWRLVCGAKILIRYLTKGSLRNLNQAKKSSLDKVDIDHTNGYAKFQIHAGTENLARRTFVILFYWALK